MAAGLVEWLGVFDYLLPLVSLSFLDILDLAKADNLTVFDFQESTQRDVRRIYYHPWQETLRNRTVKRILIRCGNHGYSANFHALRLLCSHVRFCVRDSYVLSLARGVSQKTTRTNILSSWFKPVHSQNSSNFGPRTTAANDHFLTIISGLRRGCSFSTPFFLLHCDHKFDLQLASDSVTHAWLL